MNSARRVLAVLVAVLALCVTPAAQAGVDYSMNSAGGDYAPAVTPQVEASSTDSDFAWGAAALGAGAALAVVLVVAATRTRLGAMRSRREPA